MKEVLGNVALWPAEQLLNAAIQSDRHVRDKLAPFAGKAIQINTTTPALPIRIVMEYDRIRLTALDSAEYALPVDASISGSASDLLAQLFDTNSRQALVNDNISLSGDVQLVQDLFSAIKSLDVDWQDYLAPLIGDVLTQQVSQALDDTRSWAADSRKRVHHSLDEYLKEEAKLFPHEQQLRNFNEGLDDLRLRIDRIQARAERLQQRLESITPGSVPGTVG